ncbi:hypothetical protein QET40_01460 [Akkermansia sp. N21169]|mgnify:FL=1|uniref:hypothetical protein n=1 Tax=Akkermansia sp. N21169 TaxID=3040765 RepID=UPI00244EAC56|nr:hypothetical protein [Akkermansia sp. N21169]MDH3067768.1 hypothetical protein [Akkermansia sp. N21169]
MEIIAVKYCLLSICVPFLLTSCAREDPDSMPAPAVAPKKVEHVKMPPPEIAAAITSAWLQQHIKEIESIQPGSTVAEMRKLFDREPGLFTNTRTFRYIKCPEIKIQVTIAEKYDGERDLWAPDSQIKIQKVSLPYISSFSGLCKGGLIH